MPFIQMTTTCNDAASSLPLTDGITIALPTTWRSSKTDNVSVDRRVHQLTRQGRSQMSRGVTNKFFDGGWLLYIHKLMLVSTLISMSSVCYLRVLGGKYLFGAAIFYFKKISVVSRKIKCNF